MFYIFTDFLNFLLICYSTNAFSCNNHKIMQLFGLDNPYERVMENTVNNNITPNEDFFADCEKSIEGNRDTNTVNNNIKNDTKVR